jgi:tRNA-dihydrouridine synthase B
MDYQDHGPLPMTLHIGTLEIDTIAVLAPMAGMTDSVFRQLCLEAGCGLVYTELVKADCLLRGLTPSLRNIETAPSERPVGVQLFHQDPATLAEAARWVEEHTDCDLIDLNMGCPVPKVVTKGAGAALMRQPKLVERLVRAVVDAVDLPVTAKTRSGWDATDINAVAVARAVEAGGGAAIAVHARTRAQRHEGPVDWDLLTKVKQSVSIPTLGNGGILTPTDALAMRDVTGVDAVMVGRGALGNPWIFKAIAEAWAGRSFAPPPITERLTLIQRHLRETVEANLRWAKKAGQLASAEPAAMRYVRGHLLGYVADAPGKGEFRRRMPELLSVESVLDAVSDAWSAESTAVHSAELI